MKTNKKICIIGIVAILITIIAGLCVKFILSNNSNITLPTNHIYVSDNPNHKSDFDKWLTQDLKIDWVPSYVIINNKKVIGVINGNIPINDLDEKIQNCLAINYEYCDLTDLEISNINDERKSFNDIIPDNNFYILEISWYGCEDCEYQDAHYTNSVYSKYSTDIIYRYYINSNITDVKSLSH